MAGRVFDRALFKVAGSLLVAASIGYASRTKYPAVPEDFETARDLIQDLKDGGREAAVKCAKIMAKHPLLRGFGGVVVPAPRSSDGRPSHILLAECLVRAGVGSRAIVAVVRKHPVESSRLRRRKGLPGLSYDEHVESMASSGHGIDPIEAVLIVDDMFTVGTTLRAAATVLRQAGHTGPIMGATAGFDLHGAPAKSDSPIEHCRFSV
jgi:hypothetical protein